jgi:hypothetical protein
MAAGEEDWRSFINHGVELVYFSSVLGSFLQVRSVSKHRLELLREAVHDVSLWISPHQLESASNMNVLCTLVLVYFFFSAGLTKPRPFACFYLLPGHGEQREAASETQQWSVTYICHSHQDKVWYVLWRNDGPGAARRLQLVEDGDHHGIVLGALVRQVQLHVIPAASDDGVEHDHVSTNIGAVLVFIAIATHTSALRSVASSRVSSTLQPIAPNKRSKNEIKSFKSLNVNIFQEKAKI